MSTEGSESLFGDSKAPQTPQFGSSGGTPREIRSTRATSHDTSIFTEAKTLEKMGIRPIQASSVADKVCSKAFLDMLEDPTCVHIKVGAGSHIKQWQIPKSLLTKHSSYFAAALEGPFKETNASGVTLDHDDPEAFRIFVRWLYSGEWRDYLRLPILFGENKFNAIDAANAWVLGEKIQAKRFQDVVMLSLLSHFRYYSMNSDIVLFIYMHAAPGSRLRLFAIHKLCWQRSKPQMSLFGETHKAEIWIQLSEEVEDLNLDFMRTTLTEENPVDPLTRQETYLYTKFDQECLTCS
ncbi:MAG: hypothetical protein Q9190_002328 [Brigantiaea leucoxantha]